MAKLRKNENAVHYSWGILTIGHLNEVPRGRRMAVRESELSLRRDLEGIAAQRFGAWRCGGFLA